MSRLLLKGGRVIDPASATDATLDVLIADGKVIQIGAGLSDAKAESIDVSGAVVSPGFVDMHTHLREPGREDEETIASGSAAAVAGGFSAIVAMPNTNPVCDNAAIAEKIFFEARRVGLVRVLPSGSITKGLEGKHMSPIGEMVNCSARVRMFTDDGKGVQDPRLLRRAMEYIKGFGAICAEHCEDGSLAEGGQMHEGEFSDLLGLKGIPSEAEEIPLARDVALAKLTGVRFHALHISTAGSVDIIRIAKKQGLRVTAEVTPHHLALSDAELVGYDTHLKVNPPLRSAADLESLRSALADGVIDAIATDHAPHSPEEKESEFEIAPPGMIGLETALAVGITHLVDEQVISLSQLVNLMSTQPARILGIDDQGLLAEGAVANITVFDASASWMVDAARFKSQSRNSPWEGRTLKGKVILTVFEGRLVMRDGNVLQDVLL